MTNAPSVATVNATTGVVSGVAPGSAMITVIATGSGAGYGPFDLEVVQVSVGLIA